MSGIKKEVRGDEANISAVAGKHEAVVTLT